VCDDVPALAWFLVSALVPLTLGLTALGTVLRGRGRDPRSGEGSDRRSKRVCTGYRPAGLTA